NHAAVSKTAKIFRRIKTEASYVSQRSGSLLIPIGSDGLCRIFDNKKVVLPRDLHNRVHVGHLAEKVDWNDRSSAWSYPGFDSIGVDIECSFIDICKHWPRSKPRDRGCSRGKAIGGGNHLIAGPDVDGHQCSK